MSSNLMWRVLVFNVKYCPLKIGFKKTLLMRNTTSHHKALWTSTVAKHWLQESNWFNVCVFPFANSTVGKHVSITSNN